MPVGFLLRKLLLGMRGLILLLRRRELRLVRREVQHDDRNRHQHRHHDEKRAVVHVRGPCRLAVGIQHRCRGEVQNAAHRAHQVDDGVRARAQGLGRHVGHQRYRGRAIRPHRHEQQPQRDDEQHQLAPLPRRGVAVVEDRQQIHQNHRAHRAAEDERHPPPDLRARAVAQRAEKRQQKQRQHIVRRHDRAGNGLVEVERVRQNQRDDVVVHLPERADGQKRQSHQHCAPVVELHGGSSLRTLSNFFSIVAV